MLSSSSLLRTKLVVYHDFEASHSLDTREAPHPHLWKSVLTFAGEPIKGRIIDFPELEAAVKADLKSLEGSYLNENTDLFPECRAFPTCETLGASIFTRVSEFAINRLRKNNPSLSLISVQVQLCEGERVYGAAIVELPTNGNL